MCTTQDGAGRGTLGHAHYASSFPDRLLLCRHPASAVFIMAGSIHPGAEEAMQRCGPCRVVQGYLPGRQAGSVAPRL